MALKTSDFRKGQIEDLLRIQAEQQAARDAARNAAREAASSEPPSNSSDALSESPRPAIDPETPSPEKLPSNDRKVLDKADYKPSSAIPVRVVENHPSIEPQSVKIEEGKPTSAEKIVNSVKHLEGETKTGFQTLAGIFRELYGSLKGFGRAGAVGRPGSTGMTANDPGRATRYRAYGAEANKYQDFGKTFTEKIQETYFTKRGLLDKVFDRNGIVGSFAHRAFEMRRAGNSYAEERLLRSKSTRERIDGQYSRGEITQQEYTDQIKEGYANGNLTNKTEKELRQDYYKINSLRKAANKAYNVMLRRKAEGWSKEALAASKENAVLEKSNIEIGKIDYGLGKKYADYDDKMDSRGGQRRGGRGVYDDTVLDNDGIPRQTRHTANTDSPEATESEAEPKKRRKKKKWSDFQPAPDTSDSLAVKRSENATQSSKESEEETKQADGKLLDTLKSIETNTAPITDISKFLLGNKPTEKGDAEKGEKKGIFRRAADFVLDGPKEALKGGLSRVLGKGASTVAGRALSAAGGLLGRVGLTSLASGAGLGAASAAAAPWLLGGAAVAGGGYALYKGYQYLTGDSKPPTRASGEPRPLDVRRGYMGTPPPMADIRASVENGHTIYEVTPSKRVEAVQSRHAAALRPQAIQTTSPIAPTVNAVSNVTNHNSKVITPPSKAFNDDATVGRYNRSRWT